MREAHLEHDLANYNAAMAAVAAAHALDDGCRLVEDAVAEGLTKNADEKTFILHRSLLEACRAAGDGARAELVQEIMAARALQAATPVATARVDGAGMPPRAYSQATAAANALDVAVGMLCDRLRARTCYVPRLDALPYQYTQKSTTRAQELSLQRHPEKQAIADLIEHGADELRVATNFKLCEDCHEFMKATSQLLARTICVQEPHLLHVFEPDGCSCADQWRWEARSRGSLSQLRPAST